MNKVDIYKETLKKMHGWEQYLKNGSKLPGPRANLELLEAAVSVGTEDIFKQYVTAYTVEAAANTPEEFLLMCGVVGFGKLAARGKTEYLENLRFFANDTRWRIREGAAIALQLLGKTNIDLLIHEMKAWSEGSFLEKRAVVAALCEPKLLMNDITILQVLDILDCLTSDLIEVGNRTKEEFRTLRKTLGYGWSVAVAANPERGKRLMEKWLLNEDKDIRWIMKENLRKERLRRMDNDWTVKWKNTLGIR